MANNKSGFSGLYFLIDFAFSLLIFLPQKGEMLEVIKFVNYSIHIIFVYSCMSHSTPVQVYKSTLLYWNKSDDL